MDRRRALAVFTVELVALGVPVPLFAQLSKFARIGFLGSASLSGHEAPIAALRDALRKLGYVEGKNIAIAFYWADGKYERLPDLAAELVRLKVDVLVTQGTPAAIAAKHATKTLPIVMAVIGDAVTVGVVDSLARPGANITGLTFLIAELCAKRLELLKGALPQIRQVAVLANLENPATDSWLKAMENTAARLEVRLAQVGVRGANDLDDAFAAIAQQHSDAVAITNDGMFIVNTKRIADLATKHGLPSIGFDNFADAGGLISYGANLSALFRRTAYYIDKVLNGVRPKDLPIEQPREFDLVINAKTARTLSVAISQSLLLRADRMIE